MIAKKPTIISDSEEVCIQKMIASDPDSPELTDDQIALAKPFADVFPEIARKMRKTSDEPENPPLSSCLPV